ncbi:nucleotide modification associated domain-containing protein [Brachyspira pilosicoli]|uniref:nucleotide modification associated domain-containing protein n=1 Tax=Brachyspira pilosicoli TaxID=52584 RepID=UPI003006AC85
MMNKEQEIKEWFEKNNEAMIINAFELNKNFFNIKENYLLLLHLIDRLSCENIDIDLMRYICLAFLVYKDKYLSTIYGGSCEELKGTLIKKNRDYGSSFDKSVNKFGWIYVAIELDKKKNRLHSLLKNKEKPNYESIEDTLLDIAGYCVLSLIYLENKELK